jgi:hypothetical protein
MVQNGPWYLVSMMRVDPKIDEVILFISINAKARRVTNRDSLLF